MTANASSFKSKKIVKFCGDYNITLSHSTTYYPQGNGFVESSNKILIRIIKKLLHENKKAWHKKLTFSLWEDRTSLKKSFGTSPFQLVYGK
jgi:transposase InsO family protein